MSSRSDLAMRGGAVALFGAAMAASALLYSGITPLLGAPSTPRATRQAVDRATALLSKAGRPYDQVTFCETLKAYVPDLVAVGQGGVAVDKAPRRAVILCAQHADDLTLAAARAQADGLTWVRRIAGADIVVFAADQARFDASMAEAGAKIPAGDLHDFAPTLHRLRSSLPGVVEEEEGWRVPAHADDGLVLFGPYLDLATGSYRLRLHARLQGAAAQCREAAARYRPSIAVTQDTGRGGLRPKAPASVVVGGSDPCDLTVEDAFTVAPGGAKAVETPLSGAVTLPMLVDGYALEPAAAAHSR